MSAYAKPVALAAAILLLGVLANLDIVPEEMAQYGPVALLALFPSVWLGSRRCGLAN